MEAFQIDHARCSSVSCTSQGTWSRLWREITNVRRSTCEDLLPVSDFNQNRNVPTNFNKNSKIKFCTNMSSGSLVVPWARRTDRQQTGMTWLIVVFAIVLLKHLKKNILCGDGVCLYVTQCLCLNVWTNLLQFQYWRLSPNAVKKF